MKKLLTTCIFSILAYSATLAQNNAIFAGGDADGYSSDCSVQAIASVTTSVTDKSDINNVILYYPNPCDGIFNILINQDFVNDAIIEIYNAQGQLIYNKTINNIQKGQLKTIDISNYSKGIYYMHLNFEDKMDTKKIIVK